MNNYDEYGIKIAQEASKLSYCKRLQVGAVVMIEGRPLVSGYNGTVPGDENCCEEEVQCGCNQDPNCKNCNGRGKVTRTKDSVVHAEQNAIFFAAKNGIPLKNSSMYVTHSPCIKCAISIVSSGIKRVIFKDMYRSDEGLQFLLKNKIQVLKYNEETNSFERLNN